MNEQKLVYVRTCKRCRQKVLADAVGMMRHGAVCLRFDMRDRVIRGLVTSQPYHFLVPTIPEIENVGPEKVRKGSLYPRGTRGRHR